MIICHYLYYLYFAKWNEIFVPKWDYIYDKEKNNDFSNAHMEKESETLFYYAPEWNNMGQTFKN